MHGSTRAHASGLRAHLVRGSAAWSNLIFIINIKFSDNINKYYFILIFIQNVGPVIAEPVGPAAMPMVLFERFQAFYHLHFENDFHTLIP